MATVPMRYWRIPLGCITPKASDRDVEVVSVSKRYKRDTENRPTDELDGYNLDFLAIKGCTQTIKLGLSAAATVQKIESLIADKQTIVRVKILGYNGRAYAMFRDSLMSGISITADDVEITSTESVTTDEFDEIDFAN